MVRSWMNPSRIVINDSPIFNRDPQYGIYDQLIPYDHVTYEHRFFEQASKR